MLENTGLVCVGRLNKASGLYQNPNRERFDQTFSRYLMSKRIYDQFDDYSVARPSFKREMKAVGRYGLKAIDSKPDAAHLEKVLEWLEFEFGPHVEGYRIVDAFEVDLQGSSTPGIPYKWYTRTKREAIKKYLPDISAFWKYAHRIGSKLLWHNFCKVEILPSTKVEENNIRSITGPDISYHVGFYRMVQDFNSRFVARPLATVSALGFNKYGGGIGLLAEKLSAFPNVEENDISKFDALYPEWAATEIAKNFRWRMLHPSFKTTANWERLSYYYREAIHSWIVTVTGYVLQTEHGLKSGVGTTSTDGTIHHAAAFFSAYIRLVSDDYQHFKKNVFAAFYGDDEAFSMSDEVKDRFSFENRKKCYEDFGMRLKPEAHRQSSTPEGLTFLGCRLKRLDSGEWVGQPTDPRKMVASLLKPHKSQTPAQTMARAIALTYESYWHLPTRELLWGFVQELVRSGVKPDTGAENEDIAFDLSLVGTIPTLRKIRALWLGHQ